MTILGLGGSGCLGQSDEGRRDPQAAEEAEAAEPQTLEVKPWTHDFLAAPGPSWSEIPSFMVQIPPRMQIDHVTGTG